MLQRLLLGLCLALAGGPAALAAASGPGVPPCPSDVAPVCAMLRCGAGDLCPPGMASGQHRTFANPQCAATAHARIVRQAACAGDRPEPVQPGSTVCPMLYAPVWGSKDGEAQLYPNACNMTAHGALFMGTASGRTPTVRRFVPNQ